MFKSFVSVLIGDWIYSTFIFKLGDYRAWENDDKILSIFQSTELKNVNQVSLE